MSFRDRLLRLLDEHEQLEKQHEILLQTFQKASKISDDSMLVAEGSTREERTLDGEEVSFSNHEVSDAGQRDTVVDLDTFAAIIVERSREKDIVMALDVFLQQETPSNTENPTQFRSSELQFQHDVQDTMLSTCLTKPSAIMASNTLERRFTRSDILSKTRRRARLKRILEYTESLEKEQRDKELEEKKQEFGLWKQLKAEMNERVEVFIDTWISVIIIANALFIGLQTDYDRDIGFGPWQAIDSLFTCIFVFEVGLKCRIHGIRLQFCGPEKFLNLFDVFLIVLDLLQLVLSFFQQSKDHSGGIRLPSASLFRVIRLIRIIRLLRVLRTQKFKDLISMVQGMVTGSTTLCWALLFFGMILYVVALVCRSLLYAEPYFKNVGVSMYTVYRCSFGDCSSEAGLPIPAQIISDYGGFYALTYAGVSFVITVGLFNVISAIFVDATMTSAANTALAESNSRLNDETRWATNVTLIIRELLFSMQDFHDLPVLQLSTVLDELIEVEFTREHVDTVFLGNQQVHDALDALDIDSYDHQRLSDILDPDHGGTIDVLDLMNGLQRLRGHPRRSDVVTVDLMVRKLQEVVDDMRNEISNLNEMESLLLARGGPLGVCKA